MNILKVEQMITKLLTDCVAARRVETAMREILNAYGGDSVNYEAANKSETLSVAIDLVIYEFKVDSLAKNELEEYFYSDKIDLSNYRNAEEIATDVLLGWSYILKRYTNVS